MLKLLISNLGTIIVFILVVCIVALIIYSMRKDKKQGKKSCGCGCSGCPGSSFCHPEKK